MFKTNAIRCKIPAQTQINYFYQRLKPFIDISKAFGIKWLESFVKFYILLGFS